MHKIFPIIAFLFLLTGCGSLKSNKIDDYIFKKKDERMAYLKSYNNALTLWKVPFIEDNIITSYGMAHVIISGPENAEPLVLLHGMDASSTMWYPNIEALSKNHRVYAIDFLMEAGKSVSCGEKLSIEETVAWYHEIFEHYKLKSFKIVGASRGGWLATLLAIQDNSKITKLVLLSPAQTFESMDQKQKAFGALLLKLFPNRKKLKRTLNTFSFYPEKIDPLYEKQFYLANKYSKSNSSFLQMQPFSKEELMKIKIPVLLLIGDHDVINSEDSFEKAREFIPNLKTEKIENAGHFLTIDQAERVNKTVVTFLKE